VRGLIGYARCSTVLQDLTAQREILAGLGVPADRIYLDKGLTGTSRARPGLDQALAAVRSGDTLVVPKLDRLARSVPDARQIGDSLYAEAEDGAGEGFQLAVGCGGQVAGAVTGADAGDEHGEYGDYRTGKERGDNEQDGGGGH